MISEAFIAELKQEAISTRKMLELVPLEKSDWKPHEKSMPLGQLASHVAELPTWICYTIDHDELDFAKFDYKPFIPENTKSLVNFFDNNVNKAIASLSGCEEELLLKNWTLKSGEMTFFTMPKIAVLRNMSMNHMIHHRGQLSVFLRLLDIPLPGVYGPTADNPMG